MRNLYVLYLVVLLFFCLLRRDFLCFGDAQVIITCLESDRKSLLDFKMGLKDPENRLLSWRGNDCCRWRGIKCNNRTGAVVSIDLHNPYPNNFDSEVSNTSYGFWNLSGTIDPALLKLKSLRYLDLSLNTFQNILIPEFFGSLKELQYLNLSKAGFTGEIPHSLGNMSSLQYLDLSSQLFSPLTVDNFQWVTNLGSIETLVMNGVDLSMVNSNLFRVLNRLPSLAELHLSGCGISEAIPSIQSVNLTSLAAIDLSFNSFGSTFPDWIVNISSLVYIDMSNSGLRGDIPLGLSELLNLEYLSLAGNNNLTADCSELFKGSWRKIEILDLSSNSIYGKFPASVGNMTSLVELDLFSNHIEGGIPSSIGSLCNLKNLILDGNNLTGGLPELIKSCISKSSPLPSLRVLSLSNNGLTGILPEWLGHLENLEELGLSYNSIQGPIPASLGKLSLLTDLGLGGNKLTGILPDTLGQLSNLTVFDVSSNDLIGVVSEFHFSKLSKLTILRLSSNSLVLNVSSNWVPPFQVRNLDMRSCKLGPSFPAWLETQKEVMFLDFSNASISDEMPSWFWDLSSNLSLLNVSYNQLQGQLPNPLNVAPFADVDFSSNLLQGPIPVPAFEIELLDLSKNQFSGPIPPNIGEVLPNLIFLSLSGNQITSQIPTSIGEMLSLEVLDLSRNNLTGKIPLNLQNCSFINVIDFRDNNLSGVIPELFGQLKQLVTLHLSNNCLSGELPSSLQNCSNLETLDLANNRLSGNIPPWIGESFIALKVLSLRSNEFSGNFPSQLTNLSSLQVLDLAENKFIGSIPASIGNLKAMENVRNLNQYRFYGKYRGVYYEESITVNTKGQAHIYTKTLSLVTSIDLSGNDFNGEFPEAITKLSGLVVLNLSRNHLTGNIPDGIANLHELSSLDVSMNQLSGGIPSSMSSMPFLSYLNLSNNNLSGRIPFSGQLVTFDESTYAGNLGLCGDPLPVKCERGDSDIDRGGTIEDDPTGNEFENKWFYLSIGLGFAAGLLVPVVVLAIKRPWSDAYFGFLDKIIEKPMQMRNKKTTSGRSRRSRQ